ncbi:MAG: 5-methyltetrahydropteroyltriglutamate--homocysteine S-methyltransferase [Sarcina sp.]
MVKSTIIGYPRIGEQRELKFAVEDFFKGKISEETLEQRAKLLREKHLKTQSDLGVDLIPTNDFSFYDSLLDTAFLLNIIPKRYSDLKISNLQTYFAMARGYQDDGKDVKALPMKKWFNTNYHYIVPELEEDAQIKINSNKPFELYKEGNTIAKNIKSVLIGPLTLIKLTNIKGNKNINDWIEPLTKGYIDILNEYNKFGNGYIQIDEPILVTDLTREDIEIFNQIYTKLLKNKKNCKIILQTYFGDVRDIYKDLVKLDFDGFGLDFVEGNKNFELIEKYGFPANKLIFAGVVNGKNIWINDYKKTINKISSLEKYINKNNIFLSTSCSLLHVPYTVENELNLDLEHKNTLAFAKEKLNELSELKTLLNDEQNNSSLFLQNQEKINEKLINPICFNNEVRKRVKSLKSSDFKREKAFDERRKIQKEKFKFPVLPTTTIGSFPQTSKIKAIRKLYRNNEISENEYNNEIKEKIKDVIKLQEDMGLDVLVHGEYERTDMVEYFGRLLDGFIFTSNGWVQSYGTRGVKPPIIFGDVKRSKQLTVDWSVFANGLTKKSVKGMLTGPITILNWSFPREDLDLKNISYQIGLAIGDEVLDLEKNGIEIIQIDEAALREKLPLRKEEWNTEYLDFAIPAFRLTNSKVKNDTSIHTHMCYSEFEDIIKAIEDMDADVISIEAARADSTLLDFIKKTNFKLEIGPGVYDIHSPRVPSVNEIKDLIYKMTQKINIDKIWINPDCGLKTRGDAETKLSLINMVKATQDIREELL